MNNRNFERCFKPKYAVFSDPCSLNNIAKKNCAFL